MHLHNAAAVGRICNTNSRTVLQSWNNRNALAKLSSGKIPGTIKQPLKHRFPVIGLDIEKFIRYIHSQRLTVTNSHVKACALRAAQALGSSNFYASNCWLQNFLGGKVSNRRSSCVEKVPVIFQPTNHLEWNQFVALCQRMKSSTFITWMNLVFSTALDRLERVCH